MEAQTRQKDRLRRDRLKLIDDQLAAVEFKRNMIQREFGRGDDELRLDVQKVSEVRWV